MKNYKHNFFPHIMEKKLTKVATFLPYLVKRTIICSKWNLLKTCSFSLFSLRSILNLAHAFKSPFLDIEITK